MYITIPQHTKNFHFEWPELIGKNSKMLLLSPVHNLLSKRKHSRFSLNKTHNKSRRKYRKRRRNDFMKGAVTVTHKRWVSDWSAVCLFDLLFDAFTFAKHVNYQTWSTINRNSHIAKFKICNTYIVYCILIILTSNLLYTI